MSRDRAELCRETRHCRGHRSKSQVSDPASAGIRPSEVALLTPAPGVAPSTGALRRARTLLLCGPDRRGRPAA